VGKLKGTKIPSSSFLINDHMHAGSKPCPPWERREGEEREEKRREK
jgi:hypothetical protein